MLSEPKTSSPTRRRTRSSMAVQVNSMGRVDIQVRMIIITRGTRTTISGLRSSLRQAQAILQSRDYLVVDVLEVWNDSEPHETHTVKVHRPFLQETADIPRRRCMDLFSRQMTADRAGGRCDIHTPTKSPVSWACSLTEVMSSSVESGAGPFLRGVASRTKRRVGLDIEDVGSDASGSKSRKGDNPMIGYEAMQLRISR